MAYKVGPKGQVVIAKEARERLGVRPGWIAVQRLAGDHLEVYFFPPPHERSLKGHLAKKVRRSLSENELQRAREGAWMGER
ncbi:AbrB/MazE/SpoVT family DNA-binding domain-containing protein [Oceanithermus sp.]